MDAWLESFGRWPPLNQLGFSLAVLLVGLLLVILLLMAGYQLLYYGTVLFRGWPPKGKNDPNRPTWEDIKEFSMHLAAYRKWDKERKGETKPAVPKCPPCGSSQKGSREELFENQQAVEANGTP